MSEPELIVETQAGCLSLTINRPAQRNALSLKLLDQIGDALRAVEEDYRCVVLTAAGDRCFAAGGDLKELDAVRSEAEAREMSRRGRRALDAVRQCPVPVVGALNGLALGGGAELALACDLRVASPAAEIGFLQGQLAVTTAWGGGIDLKHAIGNARALELLASARRVGMVEALELGLVSRVASEPGGLDAAINDVIGPWLQRRPQVMRGYKAMLSADRVDLHTRLALFEEDEFVLTWTHADHWEAVAAAAAGRRSAKSS